MLYLEDYLEMIEHLPQEVKDRFTEIRELDLQVQNASDKLDDRVKQFFHNLRKAKISPNERELEFGQIKSEYAKALEDADEKVHQANQMYDLVDRYLRRLDQELHKFKMELEADNAGITEVLEKRSLELDNSKENRAARPDVYPGSSGTMTPNVAYTLGHMGAGGNAIAAAASQAIAATQQLQQGRRTASLKASYEAINMGLQEFSVGRELLSNAELHQAAQQALAATAGTTAVEIKRNKRKSHHVSENAEPEPPEQPTPDWQYDPNEPRYCLCNHVSYGDMVACDNDECPIEWFHYPCVGITATPKGKWYCPQCSATMRRRGRK